MLKNFYKNKVEQFKVGLIAYSGVLLLWLGFKVGLKLELGWVCYCGWVSFELPQMKLHG